MEHLRGPYSHHSEIGPGLDMEALARAFEQVATQITDPEELTELQRYVYDGLLDGDAALGAALSERLTNERAAGSDSAH